MSQRRVLIITDSLGAPRTGKEAVTYEQTWVFHAKTFFEEKGYDVFSITHNGLHSLGLLEMAKTKLGLYSPCLTIIQCGIVDCAPRVLKEREILLAKILRMQHIVRNIAGKYHARLSEWRDISLFTKDQFRQHVSESLSYLRAVEGNKIVVVPIAPANKAYISISPRIKANIDSFNRILEEQADIYLYSFENPDDQIIESIFLEDHHHINANGHKFLFNILKNELISHDIV